MRHLRCFVCCALSSIPPHPGAQARQDLAGEAGHREGGGLGDRGVYLGGTAQYIGGREIRVTGDRGAGMRQQLLSRGGSLRCRLGRPTPTPKTPHPSPPYKPKPKPIQVYEASGSLVAATWLKTPVVLPPGASFDDYLAMELPADEVEEVRAVGSSVPACVLRAACVCLVSAAAQGAANAGPRGQPSKAPLATTPTPAPSRLPPQVPVDPLSPPEKPKTPKTSTAKQQHQAAVAPLSPPKAPEGPLAGVSGAGWG